MWVHPSFGFQPPHLRLSDGNVQDQLKRKEAKRIEHVAEPHLPQLAGL